MNLSSTTFAMLLCCSFLFGCGTNSADTTFAQNSNAVREAGCTVETHILQDYPHGYGTGGSASVWGNDFDAFLTPVMQGNTTKVNNVASQSAETYSAYTIDGKPVNSHDTRKGVRIVKIEKRMAKTIK